jgi:hypothetical protein
MLSGLREYAEEDHIEDILRQELGSNPQPREEHPRDDPSEALDNALYCGFCSRSHPYMHQTSVDRHIQDCAPEHGYKALHWRQAGWKREQLVHGFNWEGEVPEVKPERICPHCKKVFLNEDMVAKHLMKLAKTWSPDDPPRWLSTASPAVRQLLMPNQTNPAPATWNLMSDPGAHVTETWRRRRFVCGFCSGIFVADNENKEDKHLHACARKHNYVAKHWRMAGWLAGTPRAEGLLFDGGVARVHPDRICPGCRNVFKNSKGLERHRKLKCRESESDQSDGLKKFERATAPQVVIPSPHKSTRTPSGSSGLPDARATSSASNLPTPTLHPTLTNNDIANVDRAIAQLEAAINDGPPPDLQELLINLARQNPNARAVPGMPLQPRYLDPALLPPPVTQLNSDNKRGLPATAAPPGCAGGPDHSVLQGNVMYEDCSQCGLKFYPLINNANCCARHPGTKRIRAGEGAIPRVGYDDPALQARYYWDCCGKSGDAFGCRKAPHEERNGKRIEVQNHKSMPGYFEWTSK